MCTAVVAHSYAPPILEPAEHVFNLVPLFIEFPVVCDLDFAVFLRRDAGRDPFSDQGCPEPVRVISAIREQLFGFRQGIQHKRSAFVIAHLTFGEQQDHGLAAAIANSMKLRVQAAFRATDTAGNIPFFSRLAAVR